MIRIYAKSIRISSYSNQEILKKTFSRLTKKRGRSFNLRAWRDENRPILFHSLPFFESG